jgi:hypothetical protein
MRANRVARASGDERVDHARVVIVAFGGRRTRAGSACRDRGVAGLADINHAVATGCGAIRILGSSGTGRATPIAVYLSGDLLVDASRLTRLSDQRIDRARDAVIAARRRTMTGGIRRDGDVAGLSDVDPPISAIRILNIARRVQSAAIALAAVGAAGIVNAIEADQ